MYSEENENQSSFSTPDSLNIKDATDASYHKKRSLEIELCSNQDFTSKTSDLNSNSQQLTLKHSLSYTENPLKKKPLYYENFPTLNDVIECTTEHSSIKTVEDTSRESSILHGEICSIGLQNIESIESTSSLTMTIVSFHRDPFNISLLKSLSISDLKNEIFSLTNILPENQILIMYPKLILEDIHSISQYLMKNNQKIWLVVKSNASHSICNKPFQNIENLLKSLLEILPSLSNPMEMLCCKLTPLSVIERIPLKTDGTCAECGKKICVSLFICKICCKDFCLYHRHSENHSCSI